VDLKWYGEQGLCLVCHAAIVAEEKDQDRRNSKKWDSLNAPVFSRFFGEPLIWQQNQIKDFTKMNPSPLLKQGAQKQ